jgi:hypothetical protein
MEYPNKELAVILPLPLPRPRPREENILGSRRHQSETSLTKSKPFTYANRLGALEGFGWQVPRCGKKRKTGHD